MSNLILILGRSGTGKTSSLRNLTSADVNVISATGKPMPFKSDIKVYKPPTIESVIPTIDKTVAPIVVIDDANYFLSFYKGKHLMDSNPYAAPKYIAHWFTSLMEHIIDRDTDQNFYILAHTEIDDSGARVFKTTGKFVRDDLVPEGLTNIIVESFIEDGEYKFATKPLDDNSPVKTPIGMIKESSMSNDLKELDASIRGLYNNTKSSKGEK